jgi:hypothetical protein
VFFRPAYGSRRRGFCSRQKSRAHPVSVKIIPSVLFFSALLLLRGTSASLFAEGWSGISPGVNFAALRRAGPVIIDYHVAKDRERPGWIGVSVNLHGVTDIPLEPLRHILRDYENYPRYFRRSLAASLLPVEGETVVRFSLGIKILGLSFASDFICRAEEFSSTEHTFELLFTQRADFTSLDGAWGEWYLERVEIDGAWYTYYRFRASAVVISKFVLQEWIMNSFGDDEFRDLVNQLLRAAAKQ